MKHLLKIISIILIVWLFSSSLYAGIGAWTRISNATVTKNSVSAICDEQDSKLVNTGAAQGYGGQSIKTAQYEDYYLYGLIKPQILPSASLPIINVDATASMSQTVGQRSLMGKNVDCNATYNAVAAGNTIHQATTEDISISAWVNIDADAGTLFIAIDKRNVTATNGYGFAIVNYRLWAKIVEGSSYYLLTGNTSIRDNKWHHITAIFDRDNATNCKLYIDGIEDGVTNKSGVLANVSSVTNTGIFTVGSDSFGNNKFDGQICDVKISIGTVWTPTQVLYQYNNPFDISASAGTITEAYSCTEGTGTTLTALVGGAGNNLTLSNALAWNLGEVQEVEHCFQAQDTSTDIDLTVPSAISAEIAYYDNVEILPSRVSNGSLEGSAWTNIDCNALYYAQAANNTIHDITTEDISLSAWVNVDADAGSNELGIAEKYDSGSSNGYTLYLTSGKIRLQIKDSASHQYILTGNTNIRDNKWHYVTAIIDRDTAANCKIFLDGYEDGTTTKTGTITTVESISSYYKFYIGNAFGNTPTSYLLDGQIRDVKLYYAAGAHWSDAEILYQYQHPLDLGAGAGTITDSWACTDGAGTTVTGAVNNLTLSNALAWSVEQAKCWESETNATVIADTGQHAGSSCLKVTAGATSVGIKTSAVLVSGKYYTIIGYAKATSDDTAGIYVDTGNGVVITIGTTTATTWTRIRGSFKATGVNGIVYCRAVNNTDIVWFDDIAIIRDDSASANTSTKGTGIIPTNQPKILR